MEPGSLTGKEMLAAINTAAVYMAGDRSQLGSYCYGLTDGIFYAIGLLGVDPELVGPSGIDGPQDEVDRKCMAAAMRILSGFEDTFIKMASLEQNNPRVMLEKEMFTKQAVDNFDGERRAN